MWFSPVAEYLRNLGRGELATQASVGEAMKSKF